ncbi:hypothetical protein CerSpe_086290 [Prunus speciosa]
MDRHFRFLPTEEELVNHYLRKKKQDKDFKVDHIIPEIDICKHEPWDVPGLLFTEPESPYQDMEWFFFSPRDYKCINSAGINRVTPRGFWKITGKKRLIRARGSEAVIGMKRSLIFYEGRVRQSKKTNWVMYEYYEANPNPKLAQQRDFVLCRLKKIADKQHTTIYAKAEPAYAEWRGIPEEHPQPEDLELIFPALQLQDYMLEMDTEVADV